MTTELTTKQDLPQSQRFTNMVMREFKDSAGQVAITDYQRQLVQGYFVHLDQTLKKAEEDRLRKSEKNRNPVPVSWNTINMNQLALDVMHYSKIGLDMQIPNHLHPIPYYNSKTEKYDIGFIPGYEGIKYTALKYAAEPPTAVTVELVKKNDTFKVIKKSAKTPYDTYEFEITNPFDRGDVIGGFAYFEYPDKTKNKLIMMTIADIEKRKPRYASPEFWGGEKDKWENGKKVGKEKVDGWYEEMCYKTLVRHAFGKIALDPAKIDASYQMMKQREAEMADMQVAEEIATHANQNVIDVEYVSTEVVEPEALAPADEPVVVEELNTPEPAPEEDEPEF